MRFSRLRQKEVINIVDGRSLGYICDLVIEDATGHITAIVLPESAGVRWFFKPKEIVIPWKDICKIGDDVILVEADINLCGPQF